MMILEVHRSGETQHHITAIACCEDPCLLRYGRMEDGLCHHLWLELLCAETSRDLSIDVPLFAFFSFSYSSSHWKLWDQKMQQLTATEFWHFANSNLRFANRSSCVSASIFFANRLWTAWMCQNVTSDMVVTM